MQTRTYELVPAMGFERIWSWSASCPAVGREVRLTLNSVPRCHVETRIGPPLLKLPWIL